MSKKAKIWLFSGLGALAVLAIVLAVWQPWKQDETEESQGPGQLVDKDKTETEEKGLFLTVGNEEIPAVRYKVEGWSILIPETWKQEMVEESGVFTSGGYVVQHSDLDVSYSRSLRGPQMEAAQ